MQPRRLTASAMAPSGKPSAARRYKYFWEKSQTLSTRDASLTPFRGSPLPTSVVASQEHDKYGTLIALTNSNNHYTVINTYYI